MDNNTSLIVVLLISICLIGSLTFAVWFRYADYMRLVNRLSEVQILNIKPLHNTLQKWAKTSSYKWFIRVTLTCLLFFLLTLLLMMSLESIV